MKSTELDQMGFPRPCEGKPGKAEFRHEAALSAPPDPRTGNERTCVRCKKVYFVDRDGMYLRHEECVYHWGKNWMRHGGCIINTALQLVEQLDNTGIPYRYYVRFEEDEYISRIVQQSYRYISYRYIRLLIHRWLDLKIACRRSYCQFVSTSF